MKVTELISQLSTVNPDSEVYLYINGERIGVQSVDDNFTDKWYVDINADISTKEQDEIQIVWSYEDVQTQDPTLTDDEARKVLKLLKDFHDSTVGINWDTIQATIDYFKKT
jgi:hypothetical protein